MVVMEVDCGCDEGGRVVVMRLIVGVMRLIVVVMMEDGWL